MALKYVGGSVLGMGTSGFRLCPQEMRLAWSTTPFAAGTSTRKSFGRLQGRRATGQHGPIPSQRPRHWKYRRPLSPRAGNAAPVLGLTIGATTVAYIGSLLLPQHEKPRVHEPETQSFNDTSQRHRDAFRLEEVAKHDRRAARKWIVHGTKVYDITDFVDAHPGGEIILRACGGSVDAYWDIFSFHKKQDVYDILQQYFIGTIDEQDMTETGKVNWQLLGSQNVIDDPFRNDPERDPNLIVRSSNPCNAETPAQLLSDFLTPIRHFFVRNHFWVPVPAEAPNSVTIELSDGESETYTLADLKTKFKQHTITATLQCSGNRRAHMSQADRGKTSGLQWDVGAIGTSEFTGVRLRDVLLDCQKRAQEAATHANVINNRSAAKHVHFSCPTDTYSVSIPLQTALDQHGDVLLAWEMGGKPLTRDHGGPLRAIVPGVTAARSVKWLGKVSVSDEEATSQWQQRDYKCFPPSVCQADVRPEDWEKLPAIQETPVQSAITHVKRSKIEGETALQGFAFSGGGRRIARVDVSADGGKTWRQANMREDEAKGSKRWAWTLWDASFAKDEVDTSSDCRFVVKAVDEANNTQPRTFEDTWNFRGLLANAWHSVSFTS